MGQEVANLEMPVEEALGSEAPAISRKPVEFSYTIEELLSFADLERCKIRPENLDKVVWRDAPAPEDGTEGGLSLSARGLVRRDREGEVSGKSPADIPEWRKDSWRAGGSATSLGQVSRRKPYEDPSSGNAFSTSYPPRPLGSWGGENGHMRNSYDNRYWLQGQGSGRWDHRLGSQDRDREQGRPLQKWDGDDSVPPILPPDALPAAEGMRFGVPVGRPGWSPTERDGLLGSGGNLHRTYTGNFTTMRSGLDRQLSMGIPERQMSMGPHERLLKLGPADRQMSIGVPPERQMSLGGIPPPERQITLGGIPPPERQMSMGPLERQMSLGPGPLERQLSLGVMDRGGRAAIPRHPEPYHQSRISKGVTFARRDDTDSNNDETFGSEDNSTDDRAEEERRRRESFETLRKDQQRLLHEKQQKQEQRLSNAESNASRKHDETTLWDNSNLSVDKSPSPSSSSPEKVVSGSEDTISSGPVSSAGAVPVMPRPAIPPGFDKRPLHQVPSLLKPSSATDTKEGDTYVQETDNHLKQTSIARSETKATPVLQEDVSGDGSGKEPIASLVPDRLEMADPLAAITQPLEAEQAGVSQGKVGGSSTPGEAAEEWRLNSEGIVTIEHEETTRSKENNDMFVGVKDYGTTTDHQDSLLDKWFGGVAGKGSGEAAGSPALPPLVDEVTSGTYGPSQNRAVKEALWPGGDGKMSKFAQWFPPEVSKQADAVPRDILSLFPQSTTTPSAASSLSTPQPHESAAIRAQNLGTTTAKSTGRTLPMPSGPSLEDIERGLQATTLDQVEERSNMIKESAAGFTSPQRLKVGHGVDTEHDAMMSGDFGGHSPVAKVLPFQLGPTQQTQQSADMKKSSPIFLTCEDIEQSMLAEAGTPTAFETKVPNPILPLVETIGKERKPVADNAASRHLLSLLQKSGPPPSLENSVSSGRVESHGVGPLRAAQKQGSWEQGSSSPSKESPEEEEENPTLEALFGKQFMSELRAVEAPLSATVFAEDDVEYPVSRHFSSRMKTHHPSTNANIAKQWPGPIGPLSGVVRPESNVLVEVHKHGEGANVPGRLWTTNSQFAAASERKDGRTTPLSSGLGLWGNGTTNAHLSDESGLSSKLSFANKDTSVSGMDTTSFVIGDAARRDSMLSSKRHLSGLQSNPHVHISTSFEASGDSTVRAPLGSFSLSQFNVANDGNLAATQKSISGTESLVATSTGRSSDSLQVSSAFKEEVSVKRFQGNDVSVKVGATDLSTISRDESSSPSVATSQGSDSLLLATSQAVNGDPVVDGILGGDTKVDMGDNGKLADALAEIVSVGRAMDGGHNLKAPIAATAAAAAVLPDHVQQGGLSRSNSAFSGVPMRFKGSSGGLQSTSGFPPFQPIGPLQHQHSLGAEGYRSEASTLIQPRLQPGVPVHPLHHPLPQQSPGPSSIPIFPTQQFHAQPGLPQPQLLGRTFSNGSALDFPHIAYGHPPSANLNRPSPASGGPQQFAPSAAAAQGHLPQPGMYHPMGPGAAPAPAHFLTSAQVPPRAAVVHPMADPRMFIQEQQQVLHDPHGLGAKPPGPQGGPSLFPLRGHTLQSGQGAAMFHQPLPNNLRGPLPPPQNHLIPGPAAPWSVPPYSSELMRTTSKPPEPTGFANGGVMGGSSSLDRWFGMEQLGRSGSGIPSPAGLIPLSAHGLNAESNKMRFG